MADDDDGHSDKGSALLLAMLSSFLAPFMASSINVALPNIADEFSMDAVVLSWVPTSYLLSAAAFLVPFGRVADIHGRRRVFLYGIWLFTVGSLLCVLSDSSWFLIGARVVQGVGSAMIFGTSVAILTSVYSLRERGKVLGLSVSITYLGLSVGPFLGGFLTGAFGWRSIFAFVLPISVAVIYVCTIRLKGEWADSRGESFDIAGSAAYALSLTGLIVGFSLLPELSGLAVTSAGLAGILLFVFWEARQTHPVLNTDLFMRNRPFAFSNLAALINYCATFAVTFLVSLYLQYVKEMTPQEAGVILVAQPVVMAAFSPLAGRLSDRIEPRIIASVGMSISAIGLALLSLMTEGSQIWMIVASLAVLGFGFALFSSPNMNAIMSSVDRRYYGVASASVGTMRLVGQVLSLGIATVFLAIYVGSAELSHALSEEFLESFKYAFTLFAAMCVAGVFASLARGNVRSGFRKES